MTIEEAGTDNNDERFAWVALGRTVGDVGGWDQLDIFVFMIYDFHPAPGIDIPPGDVTLDFAAGMWATYTTDGIITACGDLIEALKDIGPNESLDYGIRENKPH